MSDLRNPGGSGMGTQGHPQAIPRPATAQPAHPAAPQQPGLRPPVQQQPGVRPPMGAPAIHAPRPAIAPPAPHAPQPQGDDSIALVEELTEVEEVPKPPGQAASAPPTIASKIKFGPDLGHKQHTWKRKTHVTGTGACRVKSFHAKYSEQGIEHLDDMINEWIDDHPEVEVKFVTQTVHVFEGKIREPALILNVWY